MTAISDSFTNTDGTDITAHTAGGVTWSKFANATATIQGNQLRLGGAINATRSVLTSEVFSTHNQSAEIDFDSADGVVGISVRASVSTDSVTGAGKAYNIRMLGSDLYLAVLTVASGALSNITGPITAPTSGVMRLEAEGSTIKAFVNDTEYISVTDTQVTEGRRTGVSMFPFGSNLEGDFDNFSAEDINVPTATSYTLSGPDVGQVNVASESFTLQPIGGDWPDPQTINLATDNSGTFRDSQDNVVTSLDVGGLSGPVTFTYTPTALTTASHQISASASPAIGTDPAGIAYDIVDYEKRVTTSPNGQDIHVLIPSGYDAAVGAHLVIYCHGHGGSDENLVDRSSDDTAAFLDRLIDDGYLVASSHQRGSNWGNDEAIEDIVDLYAYCVTNFRLRETLLWSVSMGGLSGLSAVKDKRIPNIKGWAGIAPVCNLASMFDNNTGTFAAAIRTAYGIAADGSDYAALTSGNDPVLLAASCPDGAEVFKQRPDAHTGFPRSV